MKWISMKWCNRVNENHRNNDHIKFLSKILLSFLQPVFTELISNGEVTGWNACFQYMNLLTEHGVPGWQWVAKVRAMTHAPPFPVPHPPQAAAASLQQQDKNFMPFIYNMLPYIILTDIKDVYFYLSRTSVSFMVRHFSYCAIKIAICPAHTDTKKIALFAGTAGPRALWRVPEHAEFFAGKSRVRGCDGRTLRKWGWRENDLLQVEIGVQNDWFVNPCLQLTDLNADRTFVFLNGINWFNILKKSRRWGFIHRAWWTMFGLWWTSLTE